ncbi:hypothetical protein A2164_02615 [Candidatus Curtissbacteria bacterium RBG_13_35_7]|uniref:Penicillin-binding protein 2 n=1 Tax=Candidatus Curtissbacteria bacterium RBG_13_35_7 TaxID=1797705 RepID=A0A1F5G4L0_9BACT|nr:MAG: hypothetical protein A2164_02615 [Candidatus Curtissbacteria bacterium RBG_13_35_7]
MRRKKLHLTWFGELISRNEPAGRLFRSDEVTEDLGFGESDKQINSQRLHIFYLIIFLILLVFLGRLFGLSVIEGAKNREKSENNRIQLVESEAERGKIFDREGRVIAYSQNTNFIEKDNSLQQITQDQAKELEKQGLAGENFEGEMGIIKQAVERKYLLGEAGAHVLGYTSSWQGVEDEEDLTVSKNQAIGRLGLEQTYNQFLTGKTGKKIIEVDTFGKKVSILGEEDSTSGRDIHLTIDSQLQKVVFDEVKNQANKSGSKRGAAVVQDVETGGILALVSVPAFDPGDIGKAVSNLDKPFFNRATQGNYPPGSIFKIVTALAGLETGVIDKNTEIEDVGEFELGGSKFSNWYFNQYGKKDGVIKIEKAIARSNDIYFYRVAEKTGLENIRKLTIKFGLGQKSGIDLPSEAVGLVPDEVWKKSAFGDNWYLGDTLHLGIGQGFLLATPVQMNVITSYIALGKLMKPYLVSKIDKGIDSQEVIISSKITAEDLVRSENLNIVRSGMRMACKTGGTGAPFFNANYAVGCKTGTAERELGNPHAWFTVYAPFDSPKIAVTVLIEDGGEGSKVAAPAAREIVDWWMVNRAK